MFAMYQPMRSSRMVEVYTGWTRSVFMPLGSPIYSWWQGRLHHGIHVHDVNGQTWLHWVEANNLTLLVPDGVGQATLYVAPPGAHPAGPPPATPIGPVLAGPPAPKPKAVLPKPAGPAKAALQAKAAVPAKAAVVVPKPKAVLPKSKGSPARKSAAAVPKPGGVRGNFAKGRQ